MRCTCDRGVSPVVAVILMVAITVILSAVIGTFVLDLGQQTTDHSSQQVGVQTTTHNGNTTVRVITGETDSLKILVNGTETRTVKNITVGEAISVSTPQGSTVTVVSVRDGSETVVARTTNTERNSVSSSDTLLGPTTGLIAYWEFEEGSGTTAYDTAGSHDGFLNGSTWNSSAKVGSYAAHVDGANQSIEATGVNFSQAESRTYSVWLYYEGTLTGANYPRLFSFNTSTGDGAGLEFAVYKSTTTLAYYDGSWHDTGVSIPTNSWVHIALTFDGSTVVVYKDGQSAYTSSSNGRENAGSVFIGNRQGYNDEGVAGLLDDARIYNQALNSSEVQNLYNETK